MHECIRNLLSKEDEESLECLCTLVTSIGKVLEQKTLEMHEEDRKNKTDYCMRGNILHFDVYFKQIRVVIDASQQKKISSRIRCLLLDLIELRQNRKWEPRRKVAGPKTIDQVHKDIEKEQNQKQLENLAYTGGPSRSMNYGGRDDRGRGGPGGQNDGRKKSSQRMDPDGWSTTPVKAAPSKPTQAYDASMNPFLQRSSGPTNPFGKKDSSAGGLRLGGGPGGGSGFASWGKGSGSKMSNAGQQSMNRFDLLSSGTDRSSSPGPGGNRMASRSVQGNMGGGGGRSDYGRNDALQAVKNFGKQSVPNGPSPGMRFGGPPSLGASMAPAIRLEIGPEEREIASNQQKVLKGNDKFANLDDEDQKEALERRLTSILNEYIHAPNVQEAKTEVLESIRADQMPFAVEHWINHVLEAKAGSRQSLGYLIVLLVKESLLQRSQVFQGIGAVLEVAEDLCCDIGPKFWDYFGELIAPMLESRLFAMNIFPETACKIEGSPCESSGKYVEAVLRLTVAKVGNKVKVAEWWSEARLSWNQFIPEDKITHFVTDRKIKENLEFTLSSLSTPSSAAASNHSSSSNSHSLQQSQDPSANSSSPDKLRERLNSLLDNNKPPQKAGLTEFSEDYIKTCKDGEPDNAFIRMVTTAVVRSCLQVTKQNNQDPSQQNIQCKFLVTMFQEKAWFLKRLLDGKRERQVQALYALVTFMVELEHPSKLLMEIFEALHEEDLVSQDSFIAWEQCKDPAQQEGKGVAIKSTIPFFNLLKEDASSGESDSDDQE